MKWPKFRRDLILNTCVGDDLDSILALRLPGVSLIPTTTFLDEFGERQPSSIASKIVVIDRPVKLNYRAGLGEPPISLPTSRYVEVRSIRDIIYTIIAAPQLRYLDLEGAFGLIDQLERRVSMSNWTRHQQFCGRKNLRRILERETGSFYARYFEFGMGEQKLTLSLRRVERPSLVPWKAPGHGYLVNMSWNNFALENRLRKSVRFESDANILALQPVEIASGMEYRDFAEVGENRFVG